ncbi:PREDICTED: transcription factor A, mitochondrial [Crocodylus porosus]|uniref:Transcription factor A, mitochondrial n=1 Tax=Crocodylus porosus TaxID=8502 RepID=A0A7M4ETZ6_CROPO|nr:PREDICTED: transcription factor A, mitochondrial [Crocodylus porosus]
MTAALLGRVLAYAPHAQSLLRCSAPCSGPARRWFCQEPEPPSAPKPPLRAFIRFYVGQTDTIKKQNPGITVSEMAKKVAHTWRNLSVSEKQAYKAAEEIDMQVYKEQLALYNAQLTPSQKAALMEERIKKKASTELKRQKRELAIFGKPKKPHSSFNFFMAERFQEAKGISAREKIKWVGDEWQNLSNSEKQYYVQLAEDDKIRYANEMKLWKEQMIEAGREDLLSWEKKSKMLRNKAKKPVTVSKVKTAMTVKTAKASSSPEVLAKVVETKKSEE